MKKSQFQIKPAGGKEGKSTEIIISDEFNIHNIEDIKAELDKITTKFQEFKIRIENLDSLDLAALQLLISFKNSMLAEGKKVDIRLTLPDNLSQIIQHSGLTEHLN